MAVGMAADTVVTDIITAITAVADTPIIAPENQEQQTTPSGGLVN